MNCHIIVVDVVRIMCIITLVYKYVKCHGDYHIAVHNLVNVMWIITSVCKRLIIKTVS